jgi:hypothetical protein
MALGVRLADVVQLLSGHVGLVERDVCRIDHDVIFLATSMRPPPAGTDVLV